MPDISDIPTAAALQQQMTTINDAISVLKMPGASLTYVTATPPTPEEGELSTPQVSLELKPPVTDETTLANIVTALEAQSATIVTALESLGYTDDTATAAEGEQVERPKPEGWPEGLSWPVQSVIPPGMMAPLPPSVIPVTVTQMPPSPEPAPPPMPAR